MLSIKGNFLINICLSLVSLIAALAMGYSIYSYFVKESSNHIVQPEDSPYNFSFFNRKGQKLSELNGMLKLVIDPFTLYKNYPNQISPQYTIDKYGFRVSYRSDKPYTAIVVGGSAAFGFALTGDDKTFASRISLYNDKYNVINSAVLGFLSGQELAQIVHYLDEFYPDLYIIFDGWNDIYGPYAITKTWPVVNSPIGYNNAFAMIEGRLFEYYQLNKKEKNIKEVTASPIGELLDERRFFKEILRTYTDNITKMRDFASSRGAEFLLVFQPELGNKKSMSQDEVEILKSWNKFKYLDQKISEKYMMFVSDAKKVFQERNIVFIDINNEAEFSGSSQTLFLDVIHPNELGHEIIAKIINQALTNGIQKRGLSRSTTPPKAPLPYDDTHSVPMPQCTLTFTAGWHGWEHNGSEWWRWTDGRGEIRVMTAEDSDLVMQGEIQSVQRPNIVDIFVNEKKVATWDITWDFFKPFEPLALRLQTGENRLGFVSHNRALRIPNDSRPLALAVRNLRAARANGEATCELQLQ
jgi:GDSL-like Lipase/Acylhydrolase